MEIVNHDPQFRYSWCSQTILRLKKVQFTRTIHKIAPCQKKMKGGEERGKDYNHSTFCDLLISELLGLPPRADNIIEVNPLLPSDAWNYFCLRKNFSAFWHR